MVRLRGYGLKRPVVLGTVGAVVLGGLALGASVAHGASSRPAVVAKAPAGRTGELTGVAAVPHSSDVWVLGNAGSTDNAAYFLGRRHHGHWQKVKAPNLHGRCGLINTIAVGSAKSVWLGGGRQVTCQTGSFVVTAPAIWRLKGKKFVAAKLPKTSNLSDAVDSMSASSATNAWAVGGLYPGATAAEEAFRWNGKAWSAVTVPSGYAQTLFDVSTSGPTNAWALRSDNSVNQYSLVHWNGKVWTVDQTEAAGTSLFSVATSSSKLAYAVGARQNPTTGGSTAVLLKFNGKTWSNVRLPKPAAHAQLDAVTMHGKSAWVIGGTANSSRPILLHSTGGKWKVENSPGKSYQLTSVSAASNTHAYAVGRHTAGSLSKTYFDAFSGHSWKGEPSKF